mmetsp:Transcript_2758/g.4157  ORF Transcript_2758/g.4157 Transcript_2758/m.4157 type:complete len:323 (+) Transcript_2758:124-1092(+)
MVSTLGDADEIPQRFELEERVYYNEEENIYEAVIRNALLKGQKWSYLVHFLGWNVRWDKWVEDRELRKATEDLRVQAAQQEEKSKRMKQEALNRKRKKREEVGDICGKRINHTPTWDDYCELPFTLKTILIDERERILRIGTSDGPLHEVHNKDESILMRSSRNVHALPASVTIKAVLKHYVNVKKKEGENPCAVSVIEKKAIAFVNGIEKIFGEALPALLLYHTERAQYISINDNLALRSLKLTEIYGCEYLLRLFVRLPLLLKHSGPSDATSRHEMGSQLVDLIVLLQKNRHVCFKADFRLPNFDELNDFERVFTTTCDK